ncbi:MAG: c-type cytochrome, partial [Planctomycetes bacterium]|nr:c-type cytochrome [Planctomycetota bacterium]
MSVRALSLLATFFCLIAYFWHPALCRATVEQQLLAEPTASLAAAAARDGNAARGAAVFFRAEMACHRCHVVDATASTGPDLARLDKKTSDQALVESVLNPSKTIAAGFQAASVDLKDGRTLIGIIRGETPDEITLCDASQPGVEIKVAKKDIETQTALAQSIMPSGQVNQLAGRQEFLDLVRYLIEVRNGGAQRARQLQPAANLLAVQIPPYEADIDHAGMIGAWGDANYDRGAAIYGQVCANCHGTEHQPGSLPTALRFSSGKFKNGSDPYSMYRTLTHGFGMMTPQTWMVPQQKYDVIFYIREELLKRQNKSQFFEVTKKYLAELPRGKSRGPEPKKNTPWTEMDYGPSLTNVYEFGGKDKNLAYKGIAVRLDPGPGGVTHGNHWMVFDHDTLRVAAGWHGQGFIDFAGIQFDGRHVVHAQAVGKIDFATPSQPGWARPDDGSFNDPRITGTDGKRYGPLPREWGRFRGVYHHGQQVVIAYNIGGAEILELPGLANLAGTAVFTRTLNISPRQQDMVLQVAQQPKSAKLLTKRVVNGNDAVAIVRLDSSDNAGGLVASVSPVPAGAAWTLDGDGNLRLRIPKGTQPLKFTVWIGAVENSTDVRKLTTTKLEHAERDLNSLTHGGPPRWPQRLETQP